MNIQDIPVDTLSEVLLWLCAAKDTNALLCTSKILNDNLKCQMKGRRGKIVLHRLQQEALVEMKKEPDIFVNMPMGSGKTALALAWASDVCNLLSDEPDGTVFICVPYSLISLWRREIERVFLGMPGFVRAEVSASDSRVYYPNDIDWLAKGKFDLCGKIVVVGSSSPSSLVSWLPLLGGVKRKVLIIDEAHMITRSGRSKLYDRANGFERRVLISATAPKMKDGFAVIRGWGEDGTDGLLPIHKVPHKEMVGYLPSVTPNVVFFGYTERRDMNFPYSDPKPERAECRRCFSGLGKKIVMIGYYPRLDRLEKHHFDKMGRGKAAKIVVRSDYIQSIFYDEVRTLINMGYSIFTRKSIDAHLSSKKSVLLVERYKASTGLDYTTYGSLVLQCEGARGYDKHLQQGVGRVVRPTNKRSDVLVTFLLTEGCLGPADRWDKELSARLLSVDFHLIKSFQEATGKPGTILGGVAIKYFKKCTKELQREILGLSDREFLFVASTTIRIEEKAAWAVAERGVAEADVQGQQDEIKKIKALRTLICAKFRRKSSWVENPEKEGGGWDVFVRSD